MKVMTDNTIHSGNVEVYEHLIYRLVDEYIENEMDEEDSVKECFVDMIFYIRDRIEKPKHEDIVLLDKLFDIYVRLCAKYRVLPTLEVFSFLVSIDRSTFTSWANGEYRNKLYYTMSGELISSISAFRVNHRGVEYKEISSDAHSHTVKKWFNICKSFVIDRLHNRPGTDANLIFTAKAAYQMRETAPEPVEAKQTQQRLVSREEMGLEAPKERPALPGTGGND